MRFKVDENLHDEVAELLRQHGHDAVTVYDQHMQGQPDEIVAAICRQEGRAVVTQDLRLFQHSSISAARLRGHHRVETTRPKPARRGKGRLATHPAFCDRSSDWQPLGR